VRARARRRTRAATSTGVVSGSSARRFAARSRRHRAGRLLLAVGAVVAAAAVGAGLWAIGWSDLLVLEDVRVEGAPEPLAVDVATAAAAPVGTPLARVDTGAMAGRVALVPAVAEVDVDRVWPSTLVVRVAPRVPLASLSTADGDRAVDRTGTVFPPVQPVDGLPRLEAPEDGGASPARAAAVGVLSALPAELAARVATVRATSDVDVELVLDDGSSVRWGGPGRTDRKAEVLTALLAQQASAYDVSAPERPTVRP
jgi:cell division protein FtsQ